MATNITFPVDELKLAELIADGWTTLTLWVSNTPDGVYTNTGTAPSPATLAAASAASTYEFTFAYSGGNPAQYYKVLAYNGTSYSSINDASPFHGGGGTTLAVLRKLVGTRLRDYVSGTTDAVGDTVTAKCGAFSVVRYPNDHFNNWFFRQTSGTEAVTQVTTFVKTNGVFTLSPAIASVGSGVSFEVTKRWTPDEYRDAINNAITTVYPFLHRTIVSTALRTTLDKFEYTIPQDIRVLSSVQLESGNNLTSTDSRTRGQPWGDEPFTPVRNGMVTTIEFRRQPTEDRRMRITGIGTLSQLNADSDYVEVTAPQTELLVYLACHYLWKLLPADAAATDIDRGEQMSDYFMALYMKDRDTFAMPRPPQMKWGHDALSIGNQRRNDFRYRPIP